MGKEIVVEYCRDGGQACVPSWKEFTNMENAKQFAKWYLKERGHYCVPKVSISTVAPTGPAIFLNSSLTPT